MVILTGCYRCPQTVLLLNGDDCCPVARLCRCIHEARVKGLVDETEAQCLRGKLSAAKDGLGGCLSVEKGVCREPPS